MQLKEIELVQTEGEAREIAIDWQNWVSEQNEIGKEPTLYTTDLIGYYDYFTKLAVKFNLTEEFKENGII